MNVPRPPETAVHATCVLWEESGILIRGPSGVGKSTLARRLLDRAASDGRFAALVADDRVLLSAASGRVIARPHRAIAGLVEIRGLGLVRADSEPACVLRLVVDLLPEPGPRLPEPDAIAGILGESLPRLALSLAGADAAVVWRTRGTHDTIMTAS